MLALEHHTPGSAFDFQHSLIGALEWAFAVHTLSAILQAYFVQFTARHGILTPKTRPEAIARPSLVQTVFSWCHLSDFFIQHPRIRRQAAIMDHHTSRNIVPQIQPSEPHTTLGAFSGSRHRFDVRQGTFVVWVNNAHKFMLSGVPSLSGPQTP
jgi:hypothetical protein